MSYFITDYVILQFLIGLGNFNSYLNKFKITATDLYSNCKQAIDDVKTNNF